MPAKWLLTLWFSILILKVVQAQSAALPQKDWWQQIELKPVVALQLWSSYTIGQKVFNEKTNTYDKVDNRLNFQLRRSRFGAKGTIGDRLKFNFTVAADLVGRDVLAGTEGGANNGSSPQLRLWNAYVLWRITPKQEWLYLSLGYQVPQVGRESTASALRVPSMEKAWSQNYLRRHLVGTGPGRSVGLHLGGLVNLAKESAWNSRYDIGIFNASTSAFTDNTTGNQSTPLLTMRYQVGYGEPETSTYHLTNSIPFFRQRHRLSIAFSGAWQQHNDLYRNNFAVGADLLLNLGLWTLEGSWFHLGRQSHTVSEMPNGNRVTAETGHLRLSHLREVNKYHLETTITYTFLHGAMSTVEQNSALAVQHFAGEESYAEFTVNWYLNKNLKISCSYTIREGKAGDFGPGAIFNNYFYQSGLGAIQRGDWLGAGLTAVF